MSENQELDELLAEYQTKAEQAAEYKAETRAKLKAGWKRDPDESPGSRCWMLTLWLKSYTPTEVERALYKYHWVGQVEIAPTTGNPHFQIFIWNTSEQANPKFSTLKLKFPIDSQIERWDPKRGTRNQCVRYVTKHKTAIGPRLGTMTDDEVSKFIANAAEDDKTQEQARKAAGDLAAAYASVTIGGKRVGQVILANPKLTRNSKDLETLRGYYMAEQLSDTWRKVECHYIWGPTRCGKSRYVRETYPGQVFRVTEWDHGPFDKYDYQDVMALEEFRGQVKFDYLLELLDGQPVEIGARYLNKWAAYHTIYVISNRPLTDFYKEQQRQHPEDWEALLARFDSISRMGPKPPGEKWGPLILESTPKLDIEARYAALALEAQEQEDN